MKKKESISIRLGEEELDYIDSQAKLCNMSRSAYVLSMVKNEKIT